MKQNRPTGATETRLSSSLEMESASSNPLGRNHLGKKLNQIHLALVSGVLVVVLGGCAVGPDYAKPDAPVSAAYGSLPPETWRTAQPSDAAARGAWWKVYNDPVLDGLMEQVAISNQNVLAAEAQYREAQGAVRVAKADYYPQVTGGPAVTRSRTYNNTSNIAGGARTLYDVPASFSWEIDLWGAIRRSVEQNIATAQATEAQLENARLSYQATLAQDYFSARGYDTLLEILNRTVDSYGKYLTLTKNRYASGVASEGDVAQAEAQFEAAKVTLAEDQLTRAQYEHAIAVLLGKPPADFHLPPAPLKAQAVPPEIPVGVPTALLERRPDIAQQERATAAANAAIGVATAAYYPTLTLSASAGFENGSLNDLFKATNFIWSLGPALSQSLFDAGKTHATVYKARAAYDAQAATYRQTVLTAFQQVEDALSGLHYLEIEASAEGKATAAAKRSLEITTNQYRAGTASYLDVITTQNTALTAEQNLANIEIRRMTSSVSLIQALGGGWDASSLPGAKAASTIPGNLLQQSPAAAAVTGQAH